MKKLVLLVFLAVPGLRADMIGGSGGGSAAAIPVPYAITTISQDNASYITTTSSEVVQCPIYTPTAVTVTGFRVDNSAGAGNISFGIYDQNGNYLVGLSSQAVVLHPANYSLGANFALAAGWYKVGVAVNNTALQLTGSNSLSDQTSLCSIGALPTNLDLSKVTLTTGNNRNIAAPWVAVLVTGGQTAN